MVELVGIELSFWLASTEQNRKPLADPGES